MPPFDDVEARGGGKPDPTGSEILVVNRASPTADGYDRGDIVVVRPADWPWGKQEDPETRTVSPKDKIVILKVPGAAFGNHRGLSRPQTHTETVDGIEEPVLDAKSRYQVDLDSLPSPVQDDLDATGKAQVAFGSGNGKVVDKETGSPVEDVGAK